MIKNEIRFKASGVEWLGEVPEHWTVCKIRRLSTVKRGASPRPIDDPKFFDDDGEFSWVRISDVTASKMYLTQTTEKLSTLGGSLSVKIYPETFFVSIAASVGKPIIAKIKCCIHDGFVYFPYLEINPKFFYYLFEGAQLFQGLGKLGTQLNLNTETIGNINIPVPPEDEIDLIISYLDRETTEIDNLIAEKEKMLALLEEKREALISRAVTRGLDSNISLKRSGIDWLDEVPEHWEVSKLGYKFSVKARLGWKGLKAEEYVDKGYIFLSTPNIKTEEIDFKNVNYINTERYFESPEIMLEVGDILVVKDGSTLGIINLVKFLPSPATVNSSIAILRAKDDLDCNFFYYFFTSSYTQNVIQRLKDGQGVPHLFQADLKKFNILFPSLKEQQDISSYLDRETAKIDKLLAAIKESIALLKERRSALITAAVTGQISTEDMTT